MATAQAPRDSMPHRPARCPGAACCGVSELWHGISVLSSKFTGVQCGRSMKIQGKLPASPGCSLGSLFTKRCGTPMTPVISSSSGSMLGPLKWSLYPLHCMLGKDDNNDNNNDNNNNNKNKKNNNNTTRTITRKNKKEQEQQQQQEQ